MIARDNLELRNNEEVLFSHWGKSDFFMLLAVFIWGVNLSVVKYALTEFPTYFFNCLRLIGASLFLLLLALASGENFRVPRSKILSLIFIGFLGNGLYQIFFIKGISLTTASNASLIMTSSPLFIALLSTLFRHERLSGSGWSGLFISFFGLYLVITQRSGGFSLSSSSLRGDLLILLANLSWAGYTIYSRPFLRIMSPLKLAALTMTAGTFFYFPVGLLDVRAFTLTEITWKGWLSLIFSFALALGVSFVFWYKSLKSVGNSRTAIYSYLTPLVAILTAHLALKERITLVQGVGGLFVLFGFSLTRSGLWWRRWLKKEMVS
jgi:drug/metabolite transporter (DMT)-like permease